MKRNSCNIGDKFGHWEVIDNTPIIKSGCTYVTMDELYEFCRKVLNHANQQPSQRLTTLEGSETNN